MPRPGNEASRTVTLIPGDGVGPLVSGAVEKVMDAMHAAIYFEKYNVHVEMKKVLEEVMESIKRNKVCLKDGLATLMGGGISSLNLQSRKEPHLFASLVNCFNLPGLPSRHEHENIVVIWENTGGEYAGMEHEVVPGVVESLKLAAWLFLESFREVATKYSGIKYNEMIVDNTCMELISRPEQFDVMLLALLEARELCSESEVQAMLWLSLLFSSFEQGASAGKVENDKLLEQKKANPVV
ncbi:hypothetical protein QQ045_000999 [Rhodiola kirilowii]